jgi:hypothetical protein
VAICPRRSSTARFDVASVNLARTALRRGSQPTRQWAGVRSGGCRPVRAGPLAGWQIFPGYDSVLLSGPGRRDVDRVRRCRRVHLVGSLVKGDRTARRPPVNEWLPLLTIVFTGVTAWSAPTVASVLWSSTGWRAGHDLASLIGAYTNLFHPERIDGAGLEGPALP